MAKHLSKTSKLNLLLGFVQFTHLVQSVNRVVRIKDQDRWENDAEHSFQLALIAWYITEHEELNLNLEKVIGMAIAHDLVEGYSGDTYFFDTVKVLAGKAKRERAARAKMKRSFPNFSSLHRLIEEYEALETPESRFVMALDKLIPILNIYLDGGRTWREKGMTLKQLVEKKTDRIALAPEVVPYYKEIVKILERDKTLFSA